VQASSTVNQPSQPQTPPRGIGYGILPARLIIPAINLNTAVDNPTSTSTASLDYELTKGPVRYPGSGTVGYGNMFIFGHSTGWKVVINKAYKVFNDLKTLTPGEVIYITSGEKTYEYRVRGVTKVDKNDTLITFDTTVNMLTLSTCDSFGAKTDRYVVTADFVGVK
jgi:LPXTG-site transpeptidase (sortase) family protein